MKKIIFTIVALISINSITVANNVVFKEVDLEKNEINKELVAIIDCLSIKFQYYNHLISQGASHEQASAGSYSVYFNCMKESPISN